MTAEEKLMANFYNGSFIEINSGDKDHIGEIMIEFAKYHVEQALKAAKNKCDDMTNSESLGEYVKKSYPIENIK